MCCKACSKISGTMAKKKAKTTVKISTEFIAGMAAGGATGGIVGGMLEKISFVQENPGMAGTIIGGVKAGAGFFLLTKTESDITQGLGAGWIADGASDLLGAFGIGAINRNTLGPGSRALYNRRHRILGGNSRQTVREPLRAKVA
ncbi:MAG: hypothetical protein MI974_31955 [Chitinophagales bacterium]|nr:hypothetical protein [Chitinophagales bacterium]